MTGMQLFVHTKSIKPNFLCEFGLYRVKQIYCIKHQEYTPYRSSYMQDDDMEGVLCPGASYRGY